MLHIIGEFLFYPTIPSVLPINLIEIIMMLMPCLEYKDLRKWKLSVKVLTYHGKVEVLHYSVLTLTQLFRDNVQSGMTPDDWNQA